MEAAAAISGEKSLGRVFAQERERQGLSRAEAAQRLHMSAYQVEALESGDFTRLPQGTFLRGFVRNYAKMLGLDPDATLALLADTAPRAPAPGIVVPSQNIRFDPLGERLTNPYVKASVLAVVAVTLVLAGLYWWLFIRAEPPASTVRKAPPPAATATAPVKGPPQQLAAVPMQAPEPVVPAPAPMEVPPDPVKSEPPKAAPAKPEPPRAARKSAPASGGTRVVRLRFRGDAWVEIRDAQGKVLLSKVNPRGSEAEVAGSPPFSVIVGNAPEVQVLVDDREFPLEPHTKVAVARFTLE